MPSNSSLKKEVQTLKDARTKDAARIAELEARLKDKDDYIPHGVAIKMANAGYVGRGDDSHLSEIKKCARAKDKRKKKRKKFNDMLEEELIPHANKLKPTKKTYSNEVIHIKLSKYHMDKMKEKDDELEKLRKYNKAELKRKNEEMSIMKEQLEEINRTGWSLYDILNGETYTGRMYDIKSRAETLLTRLGHNVYLPYKWRWTQGHSGKLICRGDTTSWEPWKLKTKQDTKITHADNLANHTRVTLLFSHC